MSKSSSARSEKHPYLNPLNWITDRSFQFWESGLYSEKSKDMYREWVSELKQNTRALAAVDKDLK